MLHYRILTDTLGIRRSFEFRLQAVHLPVISAESLEESE